MSISLIETTLTISIQQKIRSLRFYQDSPRQGWADQWVFTFAKVFEVVGLIASDLIAAAVEGLRDALPLHGHDDPVDLQRAAIGLP